MRRKPLMWFAISLLCFAGALYCWRLANEWEARKRASHRETGKRKDGEAAATAVSPSRRLANSSTASGATLLSQPQPAAKGTNWLAYRFKNTNKSTGQLLRDDRAILLENALIDSSQPLDFSIPDHLRAAADPGSYIVQSRGVLSDPFRETLTRAGARIVSYIPNNAYLVRLSAAGVQQLSADPQTQAILPYEPVYKLKSELLKLAMDQSPLPRGTLLNVMVFADAYDEMIAALQDQNTEILAESRSPFGPVLTVRPGAQGWAEIARLPGVEVMELNHERVPANDLSRVQLGISTDTRVTTNYLGLTGSNVLVNVNDTGVDQLHPDLTNRIYGDVPASLLDTNGHGTHVAGIIAGSGVVSAAITTNAQGSITPAVAGQFRGKAPGARIFSIARNSGLLRSDTYLQEAARKTNALISNNSWNYAHENTYGMAAASYDAAVRDALPEVIGSQPAVYVFAAGNGGNGNDEGLSGTRESILSPATAKNVITVGAIEQLRNITNLVDLDLSTTNNPSQPVWLGMTDSPDPEAGLPSQVASFSGRGNVGIKIEGEFGRYKPDLVAPGTFVISTRSTQWDTRAYYASTIHNLTTNLGIVVQANSFFTNTVFVPSNTFQITLTLTTNSLSPPNFNLPVFVNTSGPATPSDPSFINGFSSPPNPALNPVGTSWGYLVGNPLTNQAVGFNIVTDIVTTNDFGDYFQVLSNLNYTLDTNGFYRYEGGASLPPIGTSMAAAAVSGTLALMQEFFEQRLSVTNSPALYKALLINGARSVNTIYDFQVNKNLNLQGWGLPNLPNSLPVDATNVLKGITHVVGTSSSVLIFDQDPTNALATGQSHTRLINLSDEGRLVPLRVTLVWTDPPGNPVAGRKLVNDLNLVVTNRETGEVFVGNNIPQGSVFTFPWDPSDTNSLPPTADAVNNVENVYLFPLLGSNYSVTVYATNVNVNAVSAHPNNVVQDYALVISSGDGEFTNALSLASPLIGNAIDQRTLTWLGLVTPTNATVAISNLLEQRVGANTPLLGTTNGMTNQWHFYVITNVPFPNTVFLTRNEFNLSIPRIGVREPSVDNATRTNADIDMYLSLNPALTNLDPVVIAAAIKSSSPPVPGPTTRGRAGSEFIVITNAVPGQAYYLGVKSEDQMGAEFVLTVLSSLEPFGGPNPPGFGGPEVIPDGNPALPGHTVNLTAFIDPSRAYRVRRVVVTNSLFSENLGDLAGYLWHNDQKFVVLNNGRVAPLGDYTFVYEDNGEVTYFDNGAFSVRRTDGPGSLRDFVGDDAGGAWYFEFADDHLTQTGLVHHVSLFIEPSNLEGNGTVVSLPANTWWFDSIDVPVDGIELQVCVSSNTLPVELYLRRGDFPTRTNYDHTLLVAPPGDCLSVTSLSVPPLAAGRYYIGVFNPTALPQTIRVRARVNRNFSTIASVVSSSVTNVAILDDAVTYASFDVTSHMRIAALDVGLLIQHPRVSDLAITLISPNGTRILLFEDRGMTNAGGLGTFNTSGIGTFFNVLSNAWFYTNDFEAAPVGLYAPGAVFQGWHVLSNMVAVYPDFSDLCGTNKLLVLGDGVVSNTLPTTNSTSFNLSFQVTHAPYLVGTVAWWPLDGDARDIFGGLDGLLCCNVTFNAGKVGQAYYGDGIATSMKVPRCRELDLGRGRGFSIEGWVRPTTGSPVMSDGFEGSPAGLISAPAYFSGGWHVDAGSIDALTNNMPPFTGLQADTGVTIIDLNGTGPGTISTNLSLVVGQNYSLSFAFTRSPDSLTFCGNVPQAVVSVGGTVLATVGPANPTTWANLGWQHTSVVFTATSPLMALQVRSLTAGSCGVLLDSFRVDTPFDPAAPLVEWNDPTPTNTTPQGVQFWLSGLPGTNAPGALYANIWGTNSQPHVLATAANSITNGGWQHVALTFDAGSGAARLYTNGVVAASQPLGNFVPKTWGDLYLGYHPAGTNIGTAFAGGLDEFGVYDRALSDCEILAIFNANYRGKYGTNALTCPVALQVTLANTVGTITSFFTNGLTWANGPRWETDTITNITDLPQLATTNGPATNFTSIILRPLDPNVAVDNVVLSALVTNVLRGLVHFTEDTNLTITPIKFAATPYTITGFPPTLIFSNDFENVTQRVYNAGAVLPGSVNAPAVGVRDWTVAAGPLTVISNAGFAAVDTNWVALAGGAVQCELPTAAGHRYELSYTVRGPCAVGWWPGDIEPLSERAQDLISGNHGAFIHGATNTAAGLVVTPRGANTLYFAGMIDATNHIATKVEVGDPPQLRLTNALTIEGWVRPQRQTNSSLLGLSEESVIEQILFRGDSRQCRDPYWLALEQADLDRWHILFHVEGPNSPTCGITAEYGDPGIDDGWHHIAAVFESNVAWTNNPPWPTNQMRLYVDGQPVTNLLTEPFEDAPFDGLTGESPFADLDSAFSPGVAIGNRSRYDNSQPFRGNIDELTVYGRALTDPEIKAIHDAGRAGKADLVVPPTESLAKVSVSLDNALMDVGYGNNAEWTTRKIVFTARATNMVLKLESNLPGTLVDAVTLTELPAELNFLPEEALAALNGEDAFGTWRLELWDTRAGATNNNPQLLEWQLNFRLVPQNPLPIIYLGHGIPYAGALPAGGVQYFVVDVPQWAVWATNVLQNSSLPVTVLFNQTNFPAPGNQVLIGPNVIAGTTVLTTNTTPPLVIGQPYYLAVTNANAFPVTFSLGVWFDITTLANCRPTTNFVALAGIPRYFQFDVPTNTVPPREATFRLSGAETNVTVVLSQHLPLPNLAYADYISAQPCTNNEIILVMTNSTPFPLQTNRWYVGVFNTAPTNVFFTAEACYDASNPALIPLTNAVPYVAALTNQYVAPPGPPRFFFFTFEVTNLVDAVLFELYGMSGDADLVLERDVPPGMAPYFARSSRTEEWAEQIVLRANSELPDLRGKWYLGVYNNELTNVAYTIRASVPTNGLLVSAQSIVVTNDLLGCSSRLLSWNSVEGERYFVQYAADGVNWTTLGSMTATTPCATFVVPCLSSAYSPVSWWPAEGNAIDSVDGNHGTLLGNATYGPGEVCRGFVFDGNRDGVSLGTSTNLQLQDFSIECWVKRTSASLASFDGNGNGSLFMMGAGGGGYGFWIQQSDSRLTVGKLQVNQVTSGAQVIDTNWHHVAVTKSGTTVIFYLDGVAYAAPPYDSGGYTFAGPGCIGGWLNPSGLVDNTFFGAIDELAVYNRILSAAEIQGIYNAGSKGKCDACPAAAAGQVSLWSADGNPIDSVDGNQGTLVGDTTYERAKVCQGFVFDGIGDGVLVGNPTNLQLQNFTIEAWIKRSSSGLVSLSSRLWAEFFCYGTGGYAFGLLNSGQLFLSKVDIDQIQTFFGIGITDTNFHHVAVTKSGAAVVFYIDGVAYPVSPYNTTYTFTTPAGIGVRGDNLTASFYGWIDELAIYNRPLTATEIQAIYNGGRGVQCGPSACNFRVVQTSQIPTIITLTNAIPYFNTNSGVGSATDFYRFVVSTNAARAQFEINGPSADMTLVARKGQPLPNLAFFDYISANPSTNDELIVLFTNSTPVALSAGDWFLSAVNVSGGPATYAIKATEWPLTGRPIIVTNSFVITNSFCLTWTSLPGVHYHVEGLTSLNSTNWVTVSPIITATDVLTTWCIPLPSPYHFFRVVEGLGLSAFVPPTTTTITSITRTGSGLHLQWNGPASATYQVQWTPTLAAPVWTTVPGNITSPTGQFQFLDDGTQTGGLGPTRFYRLLKL